MHNNLWLSDPLRYAEMQQEVVCEGARPTGAPVAGDWPTMSEFYRQYNDREREEESSEHE
jgi:hypothetical protein